MFKRLLILAVLILLFWGCTQVPQKRQKLYSGWKGTIWWKLKVVKNHKVITNGGYANFIATNKFLSVNLSSPFGTTIAEIRWEKKHPDTVKLIDFFHRKVVILTFKKLSSINLTNYFLGRACSKKIFTLFKNSKAIYQFDENKKEAILKGKNFTIKWKFKEVKKLETAPLLSPPPKEFKKTVINF